MEKEGKVRYIPYSETYDEAIKGIKMKKIDEIEVVALSGTASPLGDKVVESCKISEKAFIILDGDEAVGVFGIAEKDSIGIPWLICSDKVNMKKLELVRESRAVVDYFKSKYDILTNLIHSKNEKSIRFLKHLGFEFCDKSVQITEGERRHTFLQFYYRRR